MTQKRQYHVPGATIHATSAGNEEAGVTLFWGHGWGQSGAAFADLAAPLSGRYRHLFIDFPGFGDSPLPYGEWGSADYADGCAKIISGVKGRRIWVGHSFGGKVGIQIAARHPALLDGLYLISAAGLKKKRPLHKKVHFKCRILLFKALKKLAPPRYHEKLYKTFGSADYRNAGPLRNLFVRIVNEDLSEAARQVKCPVRLIYGENDDETPVEFGERFASMIADSKLFVLKDQDHYSVLAGGRHPVAERLLEFIKEIEKG